MKKTESKREKEKRIVRLMIRLYCREKHGGRKDAGSLKITQHCVLISARLWRQRLSAATAVSIATARR